MEFNFDVQATLGGHDIVMVDGDSLARLGRRGESVCRVIDDMGTASARVCLHAHVLEGSSSTTRGAGV